MKDIDLRLRERIKMLDEIDKMIKNPQMSDKNKNNPTNQIVNIPVQNPGRNNNHNQTHTHKSFDRIEKNNSSNMDLSNDLDYPLQQRDMNARNVMDIRENPSRVYPYPGNFNTISHQNNNNHSPIINTSSNCPTTRSQNTIEAVNNSNHNPNFSNLYANFNTQFTNLEKQNNIYNTQGAQGASCIYNYNTPNSFSTKEFTEPRVKTKNQTQVRQTSSLITPHKQSLSKNSKRLDRNAQMLNININISNQNNSTTSINKSPSAIGTRLYNRAFDIKDKKERKKLEEQMNFQRQMTPDITSRAKSIQRDPKKFYERLYPYHKINRQCDQDNNRYENSDEFSNSNAYVNHNINLNLNVNSDHQMGSIHDTPNFENYENDQMPNYSNYPCYDEDINMNTETVRLNKIYRKVPDTSLGQLNFEYKPKLDKNSLKIAEKLIPAKERLLAKKKRSKSKDYYNYLNSNNNLSYSKSPSRSPGRESKSPTNRTVDLYSHGLEKMKKREILYNEKKTINENEYKKFSYRPNIITNSPVLTGRISVKSNLNQHLNSNINKSQSTDKSEFYDKTQYWKKNVDIRKEKLRDQQKNNMGSICTFKPKIHPELMPNDEKFIVKRLSQIENYVNKRRGVLKKKKDEEEYMKKKFVTGNGYKCKMTVPREFDLKTEARGRNRSKEGNLCKEGEHHDHRSLSPNHVNMMRQKLKTNEFFENQEENLEDTFERETLEYYNNLNINQHNGNHYNSNVRRDNYKQNIYDRQLNTDQKKEKKSIGNNNINSNYDEEGNINDFMSAINNLHNQLVNFKI